MVPSLDVNHYLTDGGDLTLLTAEETLRLSTKYPILLSDGDDQVTQAASDMAPNIWGSLNDETGEGFTVNTSVNFPDFFISLPGLFVSCLFTWNGIDPQGKFLHDPKAWSMEVDASRIIVDALATPLVQYLNAYNVRMAMVVRGTLKHMVPKTGFTVTVKVSMDKTWQDVYSTFSYMILGERSTVQLLKQMTEEGWELL